MARSGPLFPIDLGVPRMPTLLPHVTMCFLPQALMSCVKNPRSSAYIAGSDQRSQ